MASEAWTRDEGPVGSEEDSTWSLHRPDGRWIDAAWLPSGLEEAIRADERERVGTLLAALPQEMQRDLRDAIKTLSS